MGENTTTTEATTTEAREITFKPKNQLGSCECANWEIGFTVDGEDGDEPDVTIETTGCDKQTKRMFAQGHDAKLKSLLIRAGVAGMEVRWGRNGGVVVTSDAETAAKRFGFERQVIDGIRNRLDKMAKRKQAIPPAPRAVAAQVAEGTEEGDARDEVECVDCETPEQQQVDQLLAEATGETTEQAEPTIKAKVGRWEYEGRELADGSFEYASASGETKTAPAGKWSRA